MIRHVFIKFISTPTGPHTRIFGSSLPLSLLFYFLYDELVYLIQAEMRKDLQGLLQVLEHSHYKWMRNRISSWWSEWTKGAEAIGRKHKQRARLKKKVRY